MGCYPLICLAEIKAWLTGIISMKRGLTGYYTPLPSAAGEIARAFVPKPLPPEPALGRAGHRVARTGDFHLFLRPQGGGAFVAN